MSQNICAFVGRLTDKPAGGQTNNQRPYARFSVAVQRNFKNQNGKYDADFINCTVFGHSADYLMQYGGQGDTVSVSGELRQNHWTDQQGNNRSDLQVVANQVSIIAHPQRNQESRRHYESQQQSYQNNQQPPQGQQQTPQQSQYEQQSMGTDNGWSNTSAGQKREQLNQQNDQPVEINDDALPF